MDINRADRIIEYYARRASEYEQVYEKPERQSDLRRVADVLSTVFVGLDVLEVACGTGYWTQYIARSARSILGTDINAEVLAIAQQKDYGACHISFVELDAYSLVGLPIVNAGFHAFLWSHLPIQRVPEFLTSLHGAIPAGAPIVMIDNRYLEGSSTPISRRDERGNTYQMRELNDGSRYEVLKNFSTPAELEERLDGHAVGLRITELTYYWMAEYRTAHTPSA